MEEVKARVNTKKIAIIVTVLLSVVALLFSLYLVASANDSEKLEIYFYPLNDKNHHGTGDSCIIKLGNVEILVDAGATSSSASLIIEKMQTLCTDEKWDYIIATHADSDHISAFPSTTTSKGVFSLFKQEKDGEGWSLGTFIDFDVTMDDTVEFEGKGDLFYTETYKAYKEQRNKIVEATGAEYYTASQCCYEARGTERVKKARQEFKIGNDATINILYNYYYDHRFDESVKVDSLDRNLLSVCFLLKYKEQSFLFTGDLEEYDSGNKNESGEDKEGYDTETQYRCVNGETLLLENNKELLENGVTFYKVAHHGSKTSSSKNFIDTIRPDYAVVTAVAGAFEHKNTEMDKTFPTKLVTDRLFKYTDKIYITEEAVNDGTTTLSAKSYHGNIKLEADGSNITVTTDQYSNTKIQETSWFKKNRTYALSVYNFAMDEGILGRGACTLIKYGSIDILIDAGIHSDEASDVNTIGYVQDVKKYCVDGVLEHVIVTNAQVESIAQFIGQYNGDGTPKNNGIFGELEIENLYDFGERTNIKIKTSAFWLQRYYDQRTALIKDKKIKLYNNYDSTINVANNLTLDIMNTSGSSYQDENDYSLCTMITFYKKKLLFMADLTNAENAEKLLVKEHGSKIGDVTYYLAGFGGNERSNSNDLIDVVNPEYVVINTPLGLSISTDTFPSMSVINRLTRKTSLIYATEEIYQGASRNLSGDITFTINVQNNTVGKISLKGSRSTVIITETNWYKNNK